MIAYLPPKSLLRHVQWWLALCVALPACSLIGLRRQVVKMEAHGAITIQVTPPPHGSTPTYAVAWTVKNGERKESAGLQRVRPDGLASFSLLASHTYSVGAFTDENGNLAYDAGEPLAFVKDVK